MKLTNLTNSVDVQQVRENILKEFKDYLDSQDRFCEDNVAIMELLPRLLKLQNEKGLVYGSSWKKFGEISAFFQVNRKYDRIENIMKNAMKNGVESLHSEDSQTPTETLLDTIVDMGLYSIMWATYIKEMYPNEYNRFLSINGLD